MGQCLWRLALGRAPCRSCRPDGRVDLQFLQSNCCVTQPCPRPAHVQGSIGNKRTYSNTVGPQSTPEAGPPQFSPAAAGGTQSTTAAAQLPTPHQLELSSSLAPSVTPTPAASVEQAGQAEAPMPAKLDPFSLLPSDSDVSHLLSLSAPPWVIPASALYGLCMRRTVTHATPCAVQLAALEWSGSGSASKAASSLTSLRLQGQTAE